jgi:hypothetical protein
MYISILYTYIAKINAVVSDISPAENPQVNSKGHGETNKTMTSKVKPLEAKTSDVSSAPGPSISIPKSGIQNTEQVDHKMTSTNKSSVHKDVDHAEANGNSTQSGSANEVNNNVKEHAHTRDNNVQTGFKKQAPATDNRGHNDAKKQAHTADNNTQKDINKQAHGTNSNVQNNMKKHEHATNSSNHSAEATAHNASVSHRVYPERIPEAAKNDDSTGKSISSASKSNTAPQLENKSSAGVFASDPDVENQNNDNKDSVMHTDENAGKVQETVEEVNNPSGDEDQEEEKDTIHTDHQGNFHTYCLIKNIFILAVFFAYIVTYTHSHRTSNVECWFSALYTLYRSWATFVGIVRKLQAG